MGKELRAWGRWPFIAGSGQAEFLALRDTLPPPSDCKRHPEKWPRKEWLELCTHGTLGQTGGPQPPSHSHHTSTGLGKDVSVSALGPFSSLEPCPPLPSPLILGAAPFRTPVFTPYLPGPFGLTLCLSCFLRKVTERAVPKLFHFNIAIILSCRHLKNSTCRERFSLNSSYLPNDRSSKRNAIVTTPLCASFIN